MYATLRIASAIISEVITLLCNEQPLPEAYRDHALTNSRNYKDMSGELRLSNYLLWQLAYSELYVTECLWPDFNKEELLNAIRQYNKRERRDLPVSREVRS